MPKEKYERIVMYKPSSERIKKGLKLKKKVVPTPWIESSKKGVPVGHEGRHRVVVAKELGIKKIPVVFVKRKYEWVRHSSKWSDVHKEYD